MKLSEVNNLETYLYIRILIALSGKFLDGDYVKISDFDWDDYSGGTLKWRVKRDEIEKDPYFRYDWDGDDDSKDYNDTNKFKYDTIFKIEKASNGYMEAIEIDPITLKENVQYVEDTLGYNLRESIENYVGDLTNSKIDSLEADDVVNFFVDNYIKLDENYADSQILEHEYSPYQNDEGEMVILKEFRETQKLKKEAKRAAALKGWATRHKNELKVEAMKIATALARKKKRKTTKTKKKK